MSIETITHWGLFLVVLVVVVREVAQAMYDFLHWPGWLVRWLDRARIEEVRRVINELGIGTEDKTAIRAARTSRAIKKAAVYSGAQAVERGKSLVKRASTTGTFQVGRRYATDFPYYADVFTASLSSDYAEEAARVMLSHLKAVHPGAANGIDRIVGIKSGSPLLAFQVAQRLSCPLILFRSQQDAKPIGVGVDPQLDGIINKGDSVMIVDDSSTGGRLVIECIEGIRRVGGNVDIVLVLFEPLGKDARGLIEAQGATYVSVVPMTADVIKDLRS